MLDVTLYKRPHGRTETISMRNILENDAQYFIDNSFLVSIEELTTGDIVIYARPVFADEEDEVMVVSATKTCEDMMSELRALCEKTFS